MALKPENRYPTADAMACDVERYLADLRVEAYREPWWRTFSRWMRRHRTATLLTALLLIASLLALSGYSAFVSHLAQRERHARLEATSARNQSLRMAAAFAAQSVGFRLSDRWRILELEAGQPELMEHLRQANSQPEDTPWQQLDLWLTAIQSRRHAEAGHPESWFLCDASGRQVARWPPSPTSVGRNYAHRDYFHGNGADLLPNQRGNPPHIEQAHRSKVYASDSTGDLKVALTVPVWSHRSPTPDRQFLGVLGMSVVLGELIELQTGLESHQIAMVIDTGTNILGGRVVEGLVLHHPRHGQAVLPARPSAVAIGDRELQIVRESLAVPPLPLDPAPKQAATQLLDGVLPIDNFHDPLGPGEAQPGVAFAAPVVTSGRDVVSSHTGWVVIVVETEP